MQILEKIIAMVRRVPPALQLIFFECTPFWHPESLPGQYLASQDEQEPLNI